MLGETAAQLREGDLPMPEENRTLIGILASHDDTRVNNRLARVLDHCCHPDRRDKLEKFRFLVTGGTFRRVIEGKDSEVDKGNIQPVNPEARKFLIPRTLVLPSNSQGGVTILSYLVVERVCSILWPFFAPLSGHWLTPENLALIRLGDYCNAKRLMNSGSVEEWFDKEAERDAGLNPKPFPPEIVFRKGQPEDGRGKPVERGGGGYRLRLPEPPEKPRDNPEQMTVALIAHDRMKDLMVAFAHDHEARLARFQRIMTTGTTGKRIQEATNLKNILRYESGPKGGDIQIATEILFGLCDAAIFFVDPLNPHPHIDDIRVVFAACMRHDHVRLLTNEKQATDWMSVVSPRKEGAAAS